MTVVADPLLRGTVAQPPTARMGGGFTPTRGRGQR